MKFCNHPGLMLVNGCPKELHLCCFSCPKEDCSYKCKNENCEYIEESSEEDELNG